MNDLTCAPVTSDVYYLCTHGKIWIYDFIDIWYIYIYMFISISIYIYIYIYLFHSFQFLFLKNPWKHEPEIFHCGLIHTAVSHNDLATSPNLNVSCVFWFGQSFLNDLHSGLWMILFLLFANLHLSSNPGITKPFSLHGNTISEQPVVAITPMIFVSHTDKNPPSWISFFCLRGLESTFGTANLVKTSPQRWLEPCWMRHEFDSPRRC